MFKVLPIKHKVKRKLQKLGLIKKFEKQIYFLEQNPRHPSLNVELLEPKQHGVYSFRINRKYRALFFRRPDKKAIEILALTSHSV